jgi:rare lipoprotein A
LPTRIGLKLREPPLNQDLPMLRIRTLRLIRGLASLAVIAMLASCGGDDPARSAGTANHPAAQPAPPPANVPYKLGKPYVVNGVRYVPRDDRSYDRTGMASWYGKTFHGRTTASGRKFNMYEMTAAHTTLPTGTQVNVTNLSNGRSAVVVITDRGPFARGRIIDLSWAAAKHLGFVNQGTAKVRVTYHRPARG